MMYFPPVFNLPTYYPKYYQKHSCTTNKVPPIPPKTEDLPIEKQQCEKKEETESAPLFEIFGLKLYFDDILLLGLLFFLYSENVDDMNLYIALILLLLS